MNYSKYIGKICKTPQNEIGLVTRFVNAHNAPAWYGVNLYTGGEWQSTHPTIVAEDIDSWAIKRVQELDFCNI